VRPCERAAELRASISELVPKGRLERALRHIEGADRLCPDGSRRWLATRLDLLVELDRVDDAQALAKTVEASPDPSPEAREAAARARRAEPNRDSGATLLAAAHAARGSDPSGAQRLFERAAVHLEREQGSELALEMRAGREVASALPWRRNGTGARGLSVIAASDRLAPNGDLVALPDGQRIWVIDRRTRRPRLRIDAHEQNVTALAWSANSELLASGGYDGAAKVWNADTGTLVMTANVESVPRELRFLKRSTVLAVASGDGSTWSVPAGKRLRHITGHEEEGKAIWQVDDRGIGTVSIMGEPVAEVSLLTGAKLAGPVPKLRAVSGNGAFEALFFERAVEVRRRAGGALVRRIPIEGGSISLAAVSDDGERLAVKRWPAPDGAGNLLELYDAPAGTVLGTMKLSPDAMPVALAFTSARELVYAAAGKQEETVIDPVRGTEVRTLAPGEQLFGCTAACANAWSESLTPWLVDLRDQPPMLALSATSMDPTSPTAHVLLLDAKARTVRSLPAKGTLTGLRFVAEGRRLATWAGSELRVWDAAKATLISKVSVQGDEPAAIDAQGQLVATKRARLVELGSGKAVVWQGDPRRNDEFLAFSSDGTRMLVRQRDGALALVDASSGQRRVLVDPAAPQWKPYENEFWAYELSADGRWLAVNPRARADKELVLLGVSINQPEAPLVPLLGHLYSLDFFARYRAQEAVVSATFLEGNDMRRVSLGVLDLTSGALRPLEGELLWPQRGAVLGTRVLAVQSDPEQLLGLWNPNTGKMAGALRVLASGKAAYLALPDGRVELLGDRAAALGNAYCRLGARVFPAALCQDRFVVEGALEAILTGRELPIVP
jgi:WD40 repeat protein